MYYFITNKSGKRIARYDKDGLFLIDGVLQQGIKLTPGATAVMNALMKRYISGKDAPTRVLTKTLKKARYPFHIILQ